LFRQAENLAVKRCCEYFAKTERRLNELLFTTSFVGKTPHGIILWQNFSTASFPDPNLRPTVKIHYRVRLLTKAKLSVVWRNR
jgi:hypothetical protein